MTTAPATEASTISVPEGLVGFPTTTAYRVREVASGLFDLTPSPEEGPTFITADAAAFFPDYHPVIDEPTAVRLGLTDADDARVLLIVTVADDLARSTVNLLAPVVVNTRTGSAEQVVLTGQDFPLRAPLLDAA